MIRSKNHTFLQGPQKWHQRAQETSPHFDQRVKFFTF